MLTHAASDLHDPVKNAAVSTISGYGSKELIGYTGGSQQARWQAAQTASKELLDATSGYKLDYAAPAPFAEAQKNYEDIWLDGDKNQDFIWGRMIEGFGYGSRTYPGETVGHKDLEWLPCIMVLMVIMSGLVLLQLKLWQANIP